MQWFVISGKKMSVRCGKCKIFRGLTGGGVSFYLYYIKTSNFFFENLAPITFSRAAPMSSRTKTSESVRGSLFEVEKGLKVQSSIKK